MDIAIVIILCVLVLLAYFFEVTSAKTGIPMVVFLLIMGWGTKKIIQSFDVHIPDFSVLLGVLGTVGLILIVLEGSLEVEFDRSKLAVLKKSLLVAFFPMLAFSILFGLVFSQLAGVDVKTAISNIIPFSVISSSIAIPSSRNLPENQREFITFESSLSDILGIMLFNFLVLNSAISFTTVAAFIGQLIIISIISFAATILLSYLLGRVDHHIKYIPIIMLTVLIYELSKLLHLPSLVFIMIFGLFLSNIDQLRHIKWIKKLHPENFDKEVHRFFSFIKEVTFLVRSLFFLLLGFMIKKEDLLNTDTLKWAAILVAGIYIIRAILLKISGLPFSSLLYVAPRGLINILLFISLPAAVVIPGFGQGLLIQVMILTILVMIIGLMFTAKARVADSPASPLASASAD